MPGLLRPLRCAAASLTMRNGSGFTYRDAMSVIKREIKLSELDIMGIRPRKAVTGALLFEISGRDIGNEATRLAEWMTGQWS
jgi:hypothetical protein